MFVDFIDEAETRWTQCEADLDAAGMRLGLYHRSIWATAKRNSGAHSMFLAIRGEDAVCAAGFTIESRPIRVLPGHRVLTVSRLGIGQGGFDRQRLEIAVAALSQYAQHDRSVLRVCVDTFGMDPLLLAETGETLRRHGFAQTPPRRIYRRTLVLDLSPPEDTLFAALHRSARRNIREVAKAGYIVEVARSEDLAPRLQQLDDETRARTNGEQRQLDWRSIIRMSAVAPSISNIAVLRHPDSAGADAVLAYAWGCMQGDVAQYAESGSTRADDLKISTNYVLLWELIRWARRNGARSFDLGGVTEGTEHSADPLGGISDFKRRFSQRELTVAEEWQLEPRPGRALAARTIASGIRALRNTARHASRIKR